MTVYVDIIQYYPDATIDNIHHNDPAKAQVVKRVSNKWCHLWADTDEELHVFALRLGLKTSWFQYHRVCNHYDLTPGKRKQALALGAVEKSLVEWLRENKANLG